MSKNNKVEAEPKAAKKNNKLNMTRIKNWVAKRVAYLTLLVGASYGFRRMLENIDERFAFVLTGLLVAGLVYIISLDEN